MPQNLFGCFITQAVLAGADGVLFNQRRLTGIREIETKDDFWSVGQGSATSDWLANQPKALSADDVKHMNRYCGFTRIDRYHITKFGLMLVGGLESSFEANIDILKDALSREWTLDLTGVDGLELRGTRISIRLSDSSKLQAVQGTSFSIEYA